MKRAKEPDNGKKRFHCWESVPYLHRANPAYSIHLRVVIILWYRILRFPRNLPTSVKLRSLASVSGERRRERRFSRMSESVFSAGDAAQDTVGHKKQPEIPA